DGRGTCTRAGYDSPVDVAAVRDPDDVDEDLAVVDAVDHAVLPTTSGVVALELEPEPLAHPVRVVEQRPVDELPHPGGDALGQGLGQRLPRGSRQAQGVPHAAPRPSLLAM